MPLMITINSIGIIGAGELGAALGNTLTNKAQLQVLYYDKLPERTTTASIEDLVRACPVLLLCIPSWAVKDALKQVNKAARPNESRLVASLAKGVEKGFVTMDYALKKGLPDFYETGVLYGPMIAEEIVHGRTAAGVLAATGHTWVKPLQQAFGAAGIAIETSGDARGVALCAVFKNIYAIAFGLAEGAHLGLNAKGKLAVKVLHEMKGLVAELGGHPHTAEGIAGLGDLLATGFSEESFNYRIGKSLAEGIADEHIKSEGLVALDQLARTVDLKKYPVAQAVNQIVFHYGDPSLVLDAIQVV